MGAASGARQAVYWNTGFSLFRDVFQFALSVALARLVAPASFGQATLVTGTIGFFIVFSFRAFLGHTLQDISEKEPDYQVHFTAGAVIQVCLFALANLGALVAGQFPVYAQVQALVHVASFVFLLDLPAELRVKQLEREMNWRRMRILHVAGILGSGTLAVTLAASGAEAFALIGPSMFVSVPFIIDLAFAKRWRPDWSWSWERFRPAWRFGMLRMMSGAASAGRPLLESAVLARVAGYGTLGLYGRASGLAQILCMKFVMVFLQAVYPVLTRRASTPGTTLTNALILRGSTWIVLPVAVVASVIATPLIVTIYGARWLGAVPLVPYAMAVVAVSAMLVTSYTLLLASNMARLCLWTDVLLFAAAAASLAIALPFGIATYLATMAGAEVVLLAGLWFALVRHRLVRGAELAAAAAPPLLGVAFAFAVTTLAFERMGSDAGSPLRALAYAAMFGALYVGLLRVFFTRSLAELVSRLPAARQLSRVLLLNA